MKAKNSFSRLDGGNTVRLDLTLTIGEYETLLLMMGMATGAANRNGMGKLFWSFVRLVNSVNEGNPQFRPYAVPEEETDDRAAEAVERPT